jgi:hypothetical protein
MGLVGCFGARRKDLGFVRGTRGCCGELPPAQNNLTSLDILKHE